MASTQPPDKPVRASPDILYSSPVSLGSSSDLGGFRQVSKRGYPSSQGISHRFPNPSKSQQDGREVVSGEKRWRYTVEDIAAYRQCEGTVNYFMPPRASPSGGKLNGTSEQSRSEAEGEDLEIGGTNNDNGHAHTDVRSASFESLDDVEPSDRTPDTSNAALSRSPSAETGGQSAVSYRDHRVHCAFLSWRCADYCLLAAASDTSQHRRSGTELSFSRPQSSI